ncbi:MAG: hypothetical protein MUF49_27750 [Oculatellaceae cyanobacterium Prado106]|nr:hypothetical protein [Oculatellaceae cyanobacterium Prado106]
MPDSSARFRSATEFPKSIAQLETDEAHRLYEEMRACLIFTNKSRAQLVRRNEEHKQTSLQLKTDVARLQTMIQKLGQEKQQLAASSQLVVAELEHEIQGMARHLDDLAELYDTVADVDNPQESQWSVLALPSRFFRFLRAIRAIVFSWREERDGWVDELPAAPDPTPTLPPQPTEADRRENPQMYQDQASVGRSLLDD